jgi:hypothetical protein
MEQHADAPPQQPPSVQAGFPGVPPSPEGIKAIYFNGFAVAISAGDVSIPLFRNGVHFATLNASYSVAKTLGESLTSMITQLEKATGNHIMTAQELQKATDSK